MNAIPKVIAAILMALLVSSPALARGPGRGKPVQPAQTARFAVAPLNDVETQNLLWMREEEKVARDVYQSLYKVWGTLVFKNIAGSEQRHMDAILKKINLFGLPDPALPAVGAFSDPSLQALHDQLLEQGKLSAIDALRIGATIEDMDIRDLMDAIEATGNLALKTTYQNLLEGSKKHLRAFVGLLRAQDADYSPQFIDQALFDAILGI